MRDKIYKKIARLVTEKTGSVLIILFIFTILMFTASLRLSMRNQFSDMMPNDVPQVKSFNDLIKDFTSDAVIMLSIESKDKNIEEMKKCADEVAKALNYIPNYKIANNQTLTFMQKIEKFTGKFPIEGVKYDSSNFIKRVDAKLDIDFYKKHGLIIQKSKDIKSFTKLYSNLNFSNLLENINNNFEKEYVNDSDNLTSLDGETKAVSGLENIFNFVNSFGEYIQNRDSINILDKTNKFILGENYFISSDKTLLLVTITPAISSSNWDEMMILSKKIKEKLEPYKIKYKNLNLGLSGMPILGEEEATTTMDDMGASSLIALSLILLMLLGSFKSWKNPFNSIVSLVIALIWVSGILGITVQYLNMMSAMFGVMLIGLGIDFGIHFMSGFKEGRENSLSVKDSIFFMYTKVGNGILTGALTTSSVFFVMMSTGFKALEQMGLALGIGILSAMTAMFILLPTLIMWDNKGYSVIGNFLSKNGFSFIPNWHNTLIAKVSSIFRLKPFTFIGNVMQFKFLTKIESFIINVPIALSILIVSLILIIFSVKYGKNIKFEYDMMKMEPKGMPSVVNQNKIIDKFKISPDFALLTVNNLNDCRVKLKKLKKLGNRTEIIGRVDGITEIFTPKEEQLKNIDKIDEFNKKISSFKLDNNITDIEISKIITELLRLNDNIIEIGELSVLSEGENNKIIRKCDYISGNGKDKKSKLKSLINIIKNDKNILSSLKTFQNIYYPKLKNDLITMANSEIIDFDKIPQNIKDRYINKKGDKFLISIYPKSNIWQEKTLKRFASKTAKIDKNITGTPIITLLFINMIGEKGVFATVLGGVFIIILLLIDFRSIKYTIIALIPLIAGATFMVGIMALLDMKFNYTNFMALPIILGIGIDDGVHMLHRYKTEGKFSMPLVVKSAGKAVLLTSLTTIIGFGSVAFSHHRGLASMGLVLAIGVGTCFISSILILPAIITVYEKIKYKKNVK